MLRLNNLNAPLDYTEASLKALLLQKLRLPPAQLLSFHIARRSVDARDKQDVHFVLTVDLSLRDEAAALRKNKALTQYTPPAPLQLREAKFNLPPLVVGAGPAGLFSALMLARAGACPVLIERGKPVDERTRDVARLQQQSVLDPESNVQFGEGGAGAFSDGKLTCGIKSPYIPLILETFVRHGAPEDILINPKPHIGTDRLKGVVASIREEIRSLGGAVLFETRLDSLILREGRVEGTLLTGRDGIRECRTHTVLLCIGHSARDTLRNLYDLGVVMEQKPFAMGVRIEHRREAIDRNQYGNFAGHPALGAASYKLNCHTPDGRGVYTFCMCPGGEVIAAASELDGIVTNGMSYHARNGQNSNAALLVGVRPEDFGSSHPLAGFRLQRSIEEAAWKVGGGHYAAPAQRVEDFLKDRPSFRFGEILPSYRPGVTPCDLRDVLPPWITENLKKGILAMDGQLRGFACPDAVLTGPETRSSSPVRLCRNASGEAEGISGLYPVGEGAGYAGGIVSAAVDGIRTVVRLLEEHQP